MLEGFRILEVEGLGPAPFASMLLADLGADVIVVHRPLSNGTPGMPEQPNTFKQLVETSDALIEGFRPGVMERLGLGPDVCMDINPRLVFGRMTGWGQNSQMSSMAGHDLNYVALSGAAWYASMGND